MTHSASSTESPSPVFAVKQVTAPQDTKAKVFGAFYTELHVAEFLVWWAVRSKHATVLDPCFGGGVFLECVCRRLSIFGGQPPEQVYGVELDPAAYAQVVRKLGPQFEIPLSHLIQSDFFSCEPEQLGPVDAVVGNPPFVRYHRFTGDARTRALGRAHGEGVALSSLTSSWAPFLVHAVSFLKHGGRLALVVPAELCHAGYARPLLKFLARSFQSVTILTFRQKLFPHLSQDTLLLFAEGKGDPCSAFSWCDLPDGKALAGIMAAGGRQLPGICHLDIPAISDGRQRLIEYLLPDPARSLYRRLATQGLAQPLGSVADVGIGYVTGANAYFHLTPADAEHLGIPERYLQPAVFKAGALRGLSFTNSDWHAAARSPRGAPHRGAPRESCRGGPLSSALFGRTAQP